MLEERKNVRSPPPEEKGAAETTCDESTLTPPFLSPCTAGKKVEVGNSRISSPGRTERWGKVFLKFGFTSHYPDLI